MYHDITPDTLLNYTVAPYTNETYSLSFYTDLMNDIELTARGAVSSGGSSAYISVNSLSPNLWVAFGRLDSVYVPATTSWNITKVAKPFNEGEALDDMNILWDTTQLFLTDHSGSGGGNKDVNDWIGADKYIGFKYMDTDDTTYGWIQVACASGDSCYIKAFSYSSLSVGIQNISEDKILLFPNPFSGRIFVKKMNSQTTDIFRLKLTDIKGREMQFESDITDNLLTLELSSLPAGCYVLHYTSEKTEFHKRIIKM